MRQTLYITILIAFLGGIIAPACGFMWGGQGLHKYNVIEICTLDGIESRLVANEELPDAPKTADQCEFCFTNANLMAFFAESSRIERLAYRAEKLRYGQYTDIVLAKYHSNISSRGPPSFI